MARQLTRLPAAVHGYESRLMLVPIVGVHECGSLYIMERAYLKWLALLIFAIGISFVYAQPKEIVIIRHAEEPEGDSIHLSAKGRKRAQALAGFFQRHPLVTQFGRPVALFAPRPEPDRSRRSVETLVPTSRALGQPILTPFTQEQYVALARRILRTPAYRGKTVVIAWTHSHLNELAAALGVDPEPPGWDSDEYDRAWVIVRTRGRVTLRDIPQRLLPGDSRR